MVPSVCALNPLMVDVSYVFLFSIDWLEKECLNGKLCSHHMIVFGAKEETLKSSTSRQIEHWTKCISQHNVRLCLFNDDDATRLVTRPQDSDRHAEDDILHEHENQDQDEEERETTQILATCVPQVIHLEQYRLWHEPLPDMTMIPRSN